MQKNINFFRFVVLLENYLENTVSNIRYCYLEFHGVSKEEDKIEELSGKKIVYIKG
ncbi:hypothetical protein NARC_110014 [Candidatus Nitrosocosmicus arcticus]|uniref:Uncharacterized protein n=1 Tax=Candidatus Nitrosocosmicus arcticus TaxID=2035267 RepID=A0A557ST70_9ARCH|nr:hypothetical protein NARC_110014 [Candidatus Nitrosocosmicus arcticus]